MNEWERKNNPSVKQLHLVSNFYTKHPKDVAALRGQLIEVIDYKI